jgi:hypothetical protein
MNRTEARKQFEYVVSGIETEYRNRIRPVDQWREQEIENARKLWSPLLEGSEPQEHFAAQQNEANGKATTNEPADQEPPQQTQAGTNGSGGRRISKETIHQYVNEVLNDPSVEIVTQTEIKNRLLRDYPDAKIPSVRSGISNEILALKEQGDLDLVEEGRAGMPNKYKKTRNLF